MPNPVGNFSKHHLCIARLAVLIMRDAAAFYLDEQNFGSSATEVLLCMGVYVGQMEGRPMSALKLAQYIGMPRATVIRRLAWLVKHGLIERYGRSTYLLPVDEIRRLESSWSTTAIVRKIHMTSTELSKLNSRAIA